MGNADRPYVRRNNNGFDNNYSTPPVVSNRGRYDNFSNRGRNVPFNSQFSRGGYRGNARGSFNGFRNNMSYHDNVDAFDRQNSCNYCGNIYHRNGECPAAFVKCNFCGIQGHFAKVCKQRLRSQNK